MKITPINLRAIHAAVMDETRRKIAETARTEAVRTETRRNIVEAVRTEAVSTHITCQLSDGSTFYGITKETLSARGEKRVELWNGVAIKISSGDLQEIIVNIFQNGHLTKTKRPLMEGMPDMGTYFMGTPDLPTNGAHGPTIPIGTATGRYNNGKFTGVVITPDSTSFHIINDIIVKLVKRKTVDVKTLIEVRYAFDTTTQTIVQLPKIKMMWELDGGVESFFIGTLSGDKMFDGTCNNSPYCEDVPNWGAFEGLANGHLNSGKFTGTIVTYGDKTAEFRSGRFIKFVEKTIISNISLRFTGNGNVRLADGKVEIYQNDVLILGIPKYVFDGQAIIKCDVNGGYTLVRNNGPVTAVSYGETLEKAMDYYDRVCYILNSETQSTYVGTISDSGKMREGVLYVLTPDGNIFRYNIVDGEFLSIAANLGQDKSILFQAFPTHSAKHFPQEYAKFFTTSTTSTTSPLQ